MSEEGNVQPSNENVEMLSLNKNLNSISTVTSDLVGQDFFTFEEIKKNYLNNLISWTFLKKLSEFNQWSLGCIGNFVMNSLKEQVTAKNIYIQFEKYNNENTNEDVLSIIDDGRGISCLEFNQIMYSFSQNENKEYNFFQYGISMKTSAMRLADSFLIISKTENEVSIGLISQRLQKLIDSDLILTPIVNYKISSSASNLEGKYLPKSNYPLESINLILEQIKFMFKSIDDINNHFEQMKTGTEIYLFDLHRGMENEYEFEFNKQERDIVVNIVDKEFGSCVSSGIDTSLTCYLNFLQLNPSSTKIHILGKELNRSNPYYSIYLLSKNSSDAEKLTYLKYENENNKQIDSFYINGDYKGALFNKKYVKSLIESSNCDTNDLREENFYNGVLLYKNNYLISRLNQSKFGDFAYFIKKTIKGKEDFYKVNGYVELPSRGYELMFSGKEIKDLAVFGFLYTKIKGLMKQINKN